MTLATYDYVFTPANPEYQGDFEPVRVSAINFQQAADFAQDLAEEKNAWVMANMVFSDGSMWADERIGDWGTVFSSKRRL